ncbi:MAG: hypothetical protein QOI83_1904, partial [Streptomycetaceae bacterium]|nr:hypothetical protein [Streptomycetaceae bacterium]
EGILTGGQAAATQLGEASALRPARMRAVRAIVSGAVQTL